MRLISCFFWSFCSKTCPFDFVVSVREGASVMVRLEAMFAQMYTLHSQKTSGLTHTRWVYLWADAHKMSLPLGWRTQDDSTFGLTHTRWLYLWADAHKMSLPLGWRTQDESTSGLTHTRWLYLRADAHKLSLPLGWRIQDESLKFCLGAVCVHTTCVGYLGALGKRGLFLNSKYSVSLSDSIRIWILYFNLITS